MLSDRWTKPDESVKIEGYSFEDFKEFLTFVYSGECELSKENIFAMVDIAEFFIVEEFKEFCEEFLINTEMNFNNIYQIIETAIKFSMETLKKATISYASKNISTFLEAEKFCELDKSTLKEILELCGKTEHQEEIFKAVYQWAEKRAKEVVDADNGLNLNETIKEQISDFLPFFEYKFMGTEFLATVVFRKSFLFTDDELHNILLARIGNRVQIIDENGKKMKGEIRCDELKNVVAAIKSKKNVYPSFYVIETYYHWNTQQSKPSNPSKLTKNEKIDWYLVYDSWGDIAIKTRNQLEKRDYLLAEMFAEGEFVLNEKCKIEIV
uniref:BTB domain-containing protein n=1 Tax=Panagrolaimus sp. PS1159 TaxID=55785 RepID=A0AC35FDK9_9BILA